MRILHMNRYVRRYGGAESYMFDIARVLQMRDHDVEFFGVASPANPPMTYSEYFPSPVDREDGGTGARVRSVARMMWSTSARRGARRVIDEFRPDVIHLHNIYHDLSPSVIWAARDAGVPTVMTVHDYKLVCPSQELLNHGRPCTRCYPGRFVNAAATRCRDDSLSASLAVTAEAYLHSSLSSYGHVDTFVCPSRFMQAQLLTGGLGGRRTRVLSNFVDATSVGAPAFGGDGFLYAGRLTASKGVDVLVRAVSRVPGARLTIAGEGREETQLRALAGAVAPGQVEFVGHRSRSEVLAMMRASRALVLPARWHENQPISILEAGLLGLPVIGTSMGGVPEIVRHDFDGWVVPPDDEVSLATAMAEASTDPSLATTFGVRARERVLREHDPEAHATELESIYRGAMGRRLPR
jgi:glycosyltransferase involved in cell wall biosynthesis